MVPQLGKSLTKPRKREDPCKNSRHCYSNGNFSNYTEHHPVYKKRACHVLWQTEEPKAHSLNGLQPFGHYLGPKFNLSDSQSTVSLMDFDLLLFACGWFSFGTCVPFFSLKMEVVSSSIFTPPYTGGPTVCLWGYKSLQSWTLKALYSFSVGLISFLVSALVQFRIEHTVVLK